MTPEPDKTNAVSTYAEAGVDINAASETVLRMKEHIRSTFTPNVLADVGSFGGMYALDRNGVREPVLVSSIDGVGTKLKIAFLMNRHDTVGRDLVWHCANDILVQGARPLFFLDYFATAKLDPRIAAEVVKGMADGCRAVGCALLGGETAEMPSMYAEGEYDLAGCIVGLVDRGRIIDGRRVTPGDALIGLASDGLHTNGYSLARHALLEKAGLNVDRYIPELGKTLGEELLAPHRCYAPALLPLLNEFDIHALAHITGGGFYDNIPRSLPADCQALVDRRSWEPAPIFRLIQEAGNIADNEMFRTFNMGIGMVLVVGSEVAMQIVQRLNAAGEDAALIGQIARGNNEVQVV
uniref:Phosphoribosylformylglycinamidine cyclo-ligase n=1 Tax=uncultured Armatimonadetes bacterium TaxID=157466 RepID=A0A6J4HXL5_9BACT|nr:Phosphoribosylformylglycinamidine cyclo-ligase [uncultured Armatimonadetes bacterium]